MNFGWHAMNSKTATALRKPREIGFDFALHNQSEQVLDSGFNVCLLSAKFEFGGLELKERVRRSINSVA